MTAKTKIEKEILKKLKTRSVVPANFNTYTLLECSAACMLFYNKETDDAVHMYFSFGKVETQNYNYKEVLDYVSFVETKNGFFKCFNFRKSAYPILEYKLKNIGLSFSFHKRVSWAQDEYKAIKFDNVADEATFRMYFAEKICTPKEYRNKSGRY